MVQMNQKKWIAKILLKIGTRHFCEILPGGPLTDPFLAAHAGLNLYFLRGYMGNPDVFFIGAGVGHAKTIKNSDLLLDMRMLVRPGLHFTCPNSWI